MSQNISEPSQARDNALQQRSAHLRTLAAAVLPALLVGCELVIGGIPEKPAPDDEPARDAETPGDAALAVDAQMPAPDSAIDAGAQDAWDARSTAPDAREPIPEASVDGHDAKAAADAAVEAAPGDAGSPDAAPCSEPMWWYADRDVDGYGVAAERSFVCLKPTGSWSPMAGDCNDADERVHPGQTSYFGTPAKSADGGDSFDFDCSGSEEGTGLQTAAPDSCGLLALTACFGSGYAKTAREGSSVNRLCGSDIQLTCQAAGLLGCTTATEHVTDPYRCR